MRVSRFSPIAVAVGALLVHGCSETQGPAIPRPAAEASLTAQSTGYSGDATVVQAKVLSLEPITLVKAGPLPQSGGTDAASFLTVRIPGDGTGGLLELTAVVAHATTVGRGNASRSEASVANLQIAASGNAISAEFLHARADATCQAGNATASGGSELASLVVNGRAIVVTGEPNQTVELAGLKVVINEQRGSVSGNPADMTVNALHLSTSDPLGGQPLADVIIASAHADISCAAPPQPPPPEPVCQDFVTGGGWITGTPSGAKGNFGVAGGFKNGALWGHLTYIDHGPEGLKVKGTGVTAYVVLDATTRHIEGTAEVNGAGGFTYEVDVADNGEPGRNDTFSLTLSSGYIASGTLRGGNIQLHKPCEEAPPV